MFTWFGGHFVFVFIKENSYSEYFAFLLEDNRLLIKFASLCWTFFKTMIDVHINISFY